MKKALFIAIFALLGLSVYLPVRAETPSGVFGFLDGKLYDIDQNQTHYCFGDGNCYTMEGVFAFSKEGLAQQPVYVPPMQQTDTLPDYAVKGISDVPTPPVISPTIPTSTSPSEPAKTELDFNDLLSSEQYDISAFNNGLIAGSAHPIYIVLRIGYPSAHYKDSNVPAIGDKITLTVGNTSKVYIVNKNLIYTLTVSSDDFLPNSSYPYTIRIDRGELYGIKKDWVGTLK